VSTELVDAALVDLVVAVLLLQNAVDVDLELALHVAG
jgi:hypothetical protein